MARNWPTTSLKSGSVSGPGTGKHQWLEDSKWNLGGTLLPPSVDVSGEIHGTPVGLLLKLVWKKGYNYNYDYSRLARNNFLSLTGYLRQTVGYGMLWLNSDAATEKDMDQPRPRNHGDGEEHLERIFFQTSDEDLFFVTL